MRGYKSMEKALRKLRSQMTREIRNQLPGAAAGLMFEAGNDVPVKAGALSASVFVGTPYMGRGVAGIRAGYTDEKAPAVHEGYHGGLGEAHKSETAHKGWFSKAFYRYSVPYKTHFRKMIKQAFVKAARAKQSAGLY